MTVSMTELMRSARRCFVTGAADGAWRVADGVLTGDVPLRPGWIAIEGRGACELGEGGRLDMPDGAWQGRVWLLDPPEDFVRLLAEINEWLAGQERLRALALEQAASGVVTRRRESFGVYASETEISPGSAALSAPSLDWEACFAARLLPYRRMFPEVTL